MPVTPVALQRSLMDGGYAAGLDTIYAFNLEPQVLGELIKLYGPGIGFKDIITFGGNVIDIASDTFTAIEEGSILNYILSANAIAVGALNEGIAITVAAINTEYLLAVNDQVLIPGEYVNSAASTSPAKYQVTTDNGAGVYHLHPMLSTYQITTEVPAATNLMVTGGNYAPGAAGGNPKHLGKFHRHFNTAIKKAAFYVEGSMQSTKRYTDTMRNGQTGVFSEASMIADFLLDSYMSDELIVGVVPDAASTVTQVNSEGTSKIVRGTQGLWPALEERGMSQTYVGEYSSSDLDDLAEGFESQGVTSKFATFAMGGGLYRGAENAALDWIKEFSGGTDLMKNFGEMGFAFKRFTKNGIDTAIVKLDTFSNPLTYGLAAYDWKNSGVIFPNEFARVKNVNGGDTIELSNLTLAYKSYNGEDRRRVFGLLNGMAGLSSAPVVTGWDEVRGEFLTEFALIANRVNQMIMVTKA